MAAIIKRNKLVIITEPKTIQVVNSNLKYEIDYIIRHNGFLAKHTIKNEIGQLLSKYKHGNSIHEYRKQ